MPNKKFIRSSEHSLKFANQGKLDELDIVLQEYRQLVQRCIDVAWDNNLYGLHSSNITIPTYFNTEELKRIDTWLSARMKQCAGKQACAMLKSATKKRAKQFYNLKKFQSNGQNVRNLQSKIDRTPLVKPDASNINMELDGRFVDFENSGHFDTFVRLSSIGNRITIKLPLKNTKVSNKWATKGKQKNSIRVTPKSIFLFYEVDGVATKEGSTIAADQGSVTCLTLSDSQTTSNCPHGHDLRSIQMKLSKKQKGSKRFKKAQEHRKNYINWSLNQLNFSQVKGLRLEKLYNVGKYQRKSRFLQHWTYTDINRKLHSLGEIEGFDVTEVPNEFRSQRCNNCGFVHKKNRKAKKFCCLECGHIDDSDNNASQNLLLDLFEVPFYVRQQKLNLKGFYWLEDGLTFVGGEPIVPILENLNVMFDIIFRDYDPRVVI